MGGGPGSEVLSSLNAGDSGGRGSARVVRASWRCGGRINGGGRGSANVVGTGGDIGGLGGPTASINRAIGSFDIHL